MRIRYLGRSCPVLLLLLARLGASAAGQGPISILPPGDDAPLPRLEVGGPTSLVTALAYSPDGNTLYEAGWDKVVRVWRRGGRSGAFVLDPPATYRVPIGPGPDGAINALAGGEAYMVAELHFDDLAAIRTAFASDVGKACAADRQNFAPDPTAFQMFLFEDRAV